MVGTALVYDSFAKTILQCFCRTCQVSSSVIEKKGAPPSTMCVVRRPPKKVAFLATEVRCSEQSKGGLKYELVLSEPALEPPKVLPSTSPKSSLSAEEIKNKLKAAEERRQSVEAQRLNFLTEQLSHLNEVKGKKEEYNNNFMQSTRESLEQKMEAIKENREAHLKSIQEKVRDHVSKVDELRKTESPLKKEMLEAIEKKLQTAADAREAQIHALQERLKDHDKHVMEVRKSLDTKVETLKEQQAKKLEIAQEKRDALLKEIQEKNKEHKSHVLQVRQLNVLNQQNSDSKLQQIVKKLDEAESKRLIQFQAKQEKLLEHERHAEEVRRKAVKGNDENSSG